MPRTPAAPVSAKIPPDDPFADLIAEAYRVFPDAKPHSIEVCTRCCMDSRIAADFFNPPIERLPVEYVRDWYGAAYDPDGIAKETWAYLLPRVMEILATGEEVSPIALELSLNRFDTGNPANWFGTEWAVLDTFQRTYLHRATLHPPSFDRDPHASLDDILCMFRLGGWPLQTLLDQVAAAPDAVLAQRLWQDWYAGVAPDIWITKFWPTTDARRVREFYTSLELYGRMEALALDDRVDPPLATKAAAVADLMATMEAAWSLHE